MQVTSIHFQQIPPENYTRLAQCLFQLALWKKKFFDVDILKRHEEFMCHSPTISIVAVTLREAVNRCNLWLSPPNTVISSKIYCFLGLDLAIRHVVCKPPSLFCTNKLPSSGVGKRLAFYQRHFQSPYPCRGPLFPTCESTLIHFNITTCFSWMTTFAKNLPPTKKP